MRTLIEQSSTQKLYLFPVVFVVIIISGCVDLGPGPKIATDLLNQAETKNKPIINNAVTVGVKINPAINNDEKIDESVKESLEIALENANIFGADKSLIYRINANIMVASQSRASFGLFNGKLKINYILLDETNNEILRETVYTEAGSDKYYFAGAKRHRRARAVNISKNVLQFVGILQGKLKILLEKKLYDEREDEYYSPQDKVEPKEQKGSVDSFDDGGEYYSPEK